MNKKKLLLVEDNKAVQKFNKRLLEDEGYQVCISLTLEAARRDFYQFAPDAVILDISMPDGSGLDYLRTLRREGVKIPVLLLTGYSKNEEVETGFDAGCDDYLPKPYTFGVLHARLKRLLQNAEQVPEVVSRGTLQLRLTPREAYVDGRNLLLTPKDFTLLQFFIQNEDRLMATDYIYKNVWGQPMAGNSQALNIAVSRLRKKLAGCGFTITTEYGSGYRFERGEA